MNCINPSPSHIPGLRRLWKAAFGDEDAFLDLFFSLAFSPDRCRCVTDGETVAAAHYWFDVTCRGQKFAYLYAVATDPAYRNRGLCRMLTADLIPLLTSQGYHGILLVPQQPSLIAMYRKLGYRDCTFLTEATVPGKYLGLSLRRLTASEYAALRRPLLPPDSVLQEDGNLPFQDALYTFFAFDGGITAVHLEQDTAVFPELLGDSGAAEGLVYALGCKVGTFRFPGAGRLFSQYMPLRADCVQPAYFAFAYE